MPLFIVSIASQGVTSTQTSVPEPMVMLQPSPERDTAGSRALPAATGQALTCSNIPNCSLISWLCISQVLPRGIFEVPSQLFWWQIFSTSFVPDRNLLRTLLSSNNFFLLFWIGTADFRLHSKVTRQNAVLNHYRSPLPVPAGLSLLPDITELKLLSILLCSEYPSSPPLVFIGSLLVSPWCSPLQNFGSSQNKTRGESEPRVCKRDGEIQNWALHVSQFKVSQEGTEQNTSCFSLCWSARDFSCCP